MRIDILTLFPQMCNAFLEESIIGRARKNKCIEINTHNIRDYTKDKHRRTDDYPYGGGQGMLMTAQPIDSCFEEVIRQVGKRPHLIYMSPCGKTLTQKRVKEIALMENVAILCGHYEGIDQRIIDKIVDEEISVGDYVVTGGEMPAMILTDAVCRMLPGVLSEEACFSDESHFNGLLEYPQYTRPFEWQGMKVPDVLISGDHARISEWRKEKAVEKTMRLRPDIMK